MTTEVGVVSEMGARPYEAAVRLRAAGTTGVAGRHAESKAQLAKALAFWRAVGATRYVREAEARSAPVEAATR